MKPMITRIAAKIKRKRTEKIEKERQPKREMQGIIQQQRHIPTKMEEMIMRAIKP